MAHFHYLQPASLRAKVLEIPINMNRVENIDFVSLTSLLIYIQLRGNESKSFFFNLHPGNFSSLCHTEMHL